LQWSADSGIVLARMRASRRVTGNFGSARSRQTARAPLTSLRSEWQSGQEIACSAAALNIARSRVLSRYSVNDSSNCVQFIKFCFSSVITSHPLFERRFFRPSFAFKIPLISLLLAFVSRSSPAQYVHD